MVKRLAAAVLAAIVVGALAGCGAASSGTGASGTSGASAGGSTYPSTSSPSPWPAAASTAPATPAGPGRSGTGASTAAGELTLTGRVEQGVEPGCLIMQANGRTYELISGNPVVRAGAQVVVTGHLATGMMSHCQQGQMFQVTSARQG